MFGVIHLTSKQTQHSPPSEPSPTEGITSLAAVNFTPHLHYYLKVIFKKTYQVIAVVCSSHNKENRTKRL